MPKRANVAQEKKAHKKAQGLDKVFISLDFNKRHARHKLNNAGMIDDHAGSPFFINILKESGRCPGYLH
jgi:hypothetical protein